MDFPALPGSLARVRETVARHQAVGGWTHAVRVVAVTKTHGPDAVRAALAAGLDGCGRKPGPGGAPEAGGAAGRAGRLAPDRDAAAEQGAARRGAVRADPLGGPGGSGRRAGSPGRRRARGSAVLVQVNCSDEPQKGGVEPEGLPALLDALAGLARLEVRGLMTMSALTDDAAEQRRAFRRLRELRDAAERGGHRLPELSMGMSGDYPVAVEEGATMIRLGTVLFGERAWR